MDSVNLICDWDNPYHDKGHKIGCRMWENIHSIEALMIIERDGKPIESRISEEFESEYETSYLNFIAGLVSIRYPIKGFDKQLDGLKMTINIFKGKIVSVRSISESKLLIVIVPKGEDLNKLSSIILDENIENEN